MIKFCLPLVERTTEDVKRTIKESVSDFACFEVWLDYIEDFDMSFIEYLISITGGEIIVVFRKRNLGKIHMPIQDRTNILKKLHGTHIYVDLDMTSQHKELEFISKNELDLRLITSYHNYDDVPPMSELLKIYRTMQGVAPEIYKFAARCQDNEACFRLLEILAMVKGSKYKFIVTGMGELGKLVRVVAALSGNEFNFAPIDYANATADGQLTIGEFKKILALTEIKNAG